METKRRVLALPQRDVNLASLRECAETALEKWWKKHRKEGGVELLVSLFVSGSGSELLRSKGKMLVDADFECLGVGDSSVIRYFIETFVNERMGLDHLLPLCVYIMEQAKKYIEGCGGKTDVLYTFGNRLVGRLYATSKIAAETERIEQHLQRLFQSFYDPGKTDAALARDLEYVRKSALALRGRLESRHSLRLTRKGVAT